MRLSPIATLAAILSLAAAAPLAAQQVGADYDPNAPITLEGTADTVLWSMSQSKLFLKPNNSSQMWEIAIPASKTLLAEGLSAEVLSRGAPVKVRAFKAKDGKCDPNCKAQAVELTLDRQGKTYAFAGSGSAG